MLTDEDENTFNYILKALLQNIMRNKNLVSKVLNNKVLINLFISHNQIQLPNGDKLFYFIWITDSNKGDLVYHNHDIYCENLNDRVNKYINLLEDVLFEVNLNNVANMEEYDYLIIHENEYPFLHNEKICKWYKDVEMWSINRVLWPSNSLAHPANIINNDLMNIYWSRVQSGKNFSEYSFRYMYKIDILDTPEIFIELAAKYANIISITYQEHLNKIEEEDEV